VLEKKKWFKMRGEALSSLQQEYESELDDVKAQHALEKKEYQAKVMIKDEALSSFEQEYELELDNLRAQLALEKKEYQAKIKIKDEALSSLKQSYKSVLASLKTKDEELKAKDEALINIQQECYEALSNLKTHKEETQLKDEALCSLEEQLEQQFIRAESKDEAIYELNLQIRELFAREEQQENEFDSRSELLADYKMQLIKQRELISSKEDDLQELQKKANNSAEAAQNVREFRLQNESLDFQLADLKLELHATKNASRNLQFELQQKTFQISQLEKEKTDYIKICQTENKEDRMQMQLNQFLTQIKATSAPPESRNELVISDLRRQLENCQAEISLKESRFSEVQSELRTSKTVVREQGFRIAQLESELKRGNELLTNREKELVAFQMRNEMLQTEAERSFASESADVMSEAKENEFREQINHLLHTNVVKEQELQHQLKSDRAIHESDRARLQSQLDKLQTDLHDASSTREQSLYSQLEEAHKANVSLHDELTSMNKELSEAKTSAHKPKASRSRYLSVDSQSSLASPRKKSEMKNVRSTINTLSHTLDTVRGLHEQAEKRSERASIAELASLVKKEDTGMAKVQMRYLIDDIQKSTKKLIQENEKVSAHRERTLLRQDRNSSFDDTDLRRFPSFDALSTYSGSESSRKNLNRSSADRILADIDRSSVYRSNRSTSMASKYASDRQLISAKLSDAKSKLQMLQNAW